MDFLKRCLGYEQASVTEIMGKPVDSAFYAQHHVNNPSHVRKTANREGLKTIISLRSPVAAYVTRRDTFVDEWHAQSSTIGYWAQLRITMNLYDFVFLPVASEIDRSRILQVVTSHLEAVPDGECLKDIVKHWRRVGSTGEKASDGLDVSFLNQDVQWYNKMLDKYRFGVYGRRS